jgi:hypothetical protein
VRRHRALAVTASASLVLVAAGTAGAATVHHTTPAKAKANSSFTLLRVSAAGQAVSVGRITSLADRRTQPHTARLVLTPIDSTLTGPVGQQEITPTNSPGSAGPVSTVALPGGLGTVSGPKLTAQAVDSAVTTLANAAVSTLSVHLVSLPLTITLPALSDLAESTSTHAVGQKSLSLGAFRLPDVLAMLQGLGLDTSALTPTVLAALDGVVGTVSGAVTTLVTTIAADQTAVQTATGNPAPTTLKSAAAALVSAGSTLDGDVTALNTALQTPAIATAVATAVGALPGSPAVPTFPLTTAQWKALSSAVQGAIATAAGIATLAADTDVVTTLQTLVTDLTTLVTDVTNDLKANPLAELDGISVKTLARAASTPTATASADLGTLKVLGAPVASVAALSAQLTSVLDSLAATLNGLTGVTFTAPTVSLGTPVVSKGRSGATRNAAAAITGLTVNLPAITLPAALSLTGAPVSTPTGTVAVGVLADTAQFTPAVTTTTTTPDVTPQQGPGLAETGAPFALPTFAALLLTAAFVLRRRSRRLASIED